MSLFDSIEKNTYSLVTRLYGDTAIWIPTNGSAQQTAKVLFNNPTKNQKLSDVVYDPRDWQMEYHKEDFIQLKDLVDSGTNQVVTINGISYYVKAVYTKWDGDISMAKLEIVE